MWHCELRNPSLRTGKDFFFYKLSPCVMLGRVDSEINAVRCKANLKTENNTQSLGLNKQQHLEI